LDSAHRLTRAAPATPVSSARLGIAVAATLGVLLVCWAATIGRYGGPDEPAHVVRAYAVAHGEVRGDAAPGLAPGYRVVRVPSSLGTGDPACYRHDPTTTSTCAAADPAASPFVRVATSAGANPPLYYAVVGLLPRVAGVEGDPLAYRLAAVALVAMAIGAAAARLRLEAGRAVLLAALVAPSCWFLWGVVNPNGLETALVALAATGIVRRSSGRALLWTSLPLAFAIAMRPIALAWAIAMLALIELRERREVHGRLQRRDRVVLWSPIAAAVATVAAWSAWSGLVIDDDRTARTGSVIAAVGDSLGGVPRSSLELVASMGWLEFWAPWPAVAAWCAAATAVVVAVVRRRSAATAPPTALPTAVWLVLLGAALVVPLVFEVALYEHVGPIWQGRYLLPVLAIAAVVAVGTITRVPARLARVVVALAGVAAVTTHWAVARRYSVGTDGSWWLHHGDHTSRWLTPGWWVVVHGVAVSVVVARLLIACRSPRPHASALRQTM